MFDPQHYFFFFLELTVRLTSSNYIVDADDGIVQVCAETNIANSELFTVTISAAERTPVDAVG